MNMNGLNNIVKPVKNANRIVPLKLSMMKKLFQLKISPELGH